MSQLFFVSHCCSQRNYLSLAEQVGLQLRWDFVDTSIFFFPIATTVFAGCFLAWKSFKLSWQKRTVYASVYQSPSKLLWAIGHVYMNLPLSDQCQDFSRNSLGVDSLELRWYMYIGSATEFVRPILAGVSLARLESRIIQWAGDKPDYRILHAQPCKSESTLTYYPVPQLQPPTPDTPIRWSCNTAGSALRTPHSVAESSFSVDNQRENRLFWNIIAVKSVKALNWYRTVPYRT